MRRTVSDDISIPSPTYRVPRHRGMDPATRRLALIAGGIGGTLLLIVGGWSLLGGGPHGVPVVQPAAGPVRVKPANPGGLQVAGTHNDIFSGGSDTTVDKLAPPPEVPDPQALRATAPPPPRLATALPAPPAAEPAIAPMQVSAPPARPAPVAASEHATRPVEDRAAARDHRAEPQAAAARAGGKGTLVQLAALSSEAAARAEWRILSRRLPQLLGGRQPVFSKVEHAGHVFWRVRTGGFSDLAQAKAFCEQLRGKGLGCSVADF